LSKIPLQIEGVAIEINSPFKPPPAPPKEESPKISPPLEGLGEVKLPFRLKEWQTLV
jgi:hypothetical protein